MTRRPAWVLGAAACAALLAVPAHAGKVRAAAAAEAPPWLREAAARPVPPGAAGYVVLLDECTWEPLVDGGVRETRRVAYRVLSDTAGAKVDAHAVYYQQGRDPQPGIRAWVLPGDGTLVLPNPNGKDVSDGPVGGAGYSLFDDYRVRVIEVGLLEKGAVVGYEHDVRHALDLGAEEFTFGSGGAVTLSARATLRLPAGWSGDALLVHADDRVRVTRGEREIVLEAGPLEPRPARDPQPRDVDVIPRAWLRWHDPSGTRGHADWNAVCAFSETLQRPSLARPGNAAALAASFKSDDLAATLAHAFDWAARSVRYVSITLGMGGFQSHAPEDVIRHQYGDCKDKATLLRAFGGALGLAAYPVHVRTRAEGPLLRDVPTPAQFDHMIAAVRLPDGALPEAWNAVDVAGVGRVMFLDATASLNPYDDLPDMDQGTVALLCDGNVAHLVTLPVAPPAASVRRTTLAAALAENGTLGASTSVESFSGGIAAGWRGELGPLSADRRTKTLTEVLHASFPGATVDALDVAGLTGVGGTLTVTAKHHAAQFGNRVGDLLVVEPARAGAAPLGLVVTGDAPPWPVQLRRGTGRWRLEVTLDVPPGWRPETLPRAVEADAPELHVSAAWTFADGKLSYVRTADVKAPEVLPGGWAPFRDAAVKLAKADGAGIVLVKKP